MLTQPINHTNNLSNSSPAAAAAAAAAANTNSSANQLIAASPSAAAPSSSSSSAPMPKVQDALGYLERVKTRFSSTPLVYSQFLDIMKDFKSQTIDTEGVIKRVKILFKGHRSLILGFNQFLPAGYKIEIGPEFNQANLEQPPSLPIANNPPNTNPVLASQVSNASQQITAAGNINPAQSITQPSAGSGSLVAAPPANSSRIKPTTEFNHAVQYVAKIKHRFREAPEIYGEFLDILHDYQAKRTIDEVYTRVSRLFQFQPDLLEEFKYFLPDSAREHANRTGQGAGNSQNKGSQQPRPRPKPGKKQLDNKANIQSNKPNPNATNQRTNDKDKRDKQQKEHKQGRPKPQGPQGTQSHTVSYLHKCTLLSLTNLSLLCMLYLDRSTERSCAVCEQASIRFRLPQEVYNLSS
jgi:paired amphipathic helix protein Sin3a